MTGASLAADSGPDAHPGRWRMLTLLATAELLGMSLWFVANAVAGELSRPWQLNVSQIGWLTTIVQLGFVCGTATVAVLNLADIIPSRALFAWSAVLGAGVNAAILVADSYAVALGLRFLTGCFLAGVYPPAMKMISTWFRSQRGLAIGTIVGALTVGKATPYLIHAIPAVSPTQVILVASTGAVVAGLLVVLGYRDGPFTFASRPFSWGLVSTVAQERKWRLATASYLGHMWELYAFWAWIPAFLVASVAAGGGQAASDRAISMLAFATIAVGGAGCVWGGHYADTNGRERLVTIALLASGGCCLLSALLFGAPLPALAALSLVWGFFVIADSAQFSTLVTESVPPHAIGTALAVQTSLGFLLTMLPMQLIPVFAGHYGWRWSFVFLALGPATGIASIRVLRRLRTT